MNAHSDYLHVIPEVRQALDAGLPVVALESTVISHGLPRPKNLEVARQCEAAIREEGAIPATVGIIGGTIIIGLNNNALRANRHALTATDAFIGKKDNLRIGGHTFRIGTPPARKRAAFEKHDSPYAGTVVNTEPFDVENQSARGGVCFWIRNYHRCSVRAMS